MSDNAKYYNYYKTDPQTATEKSSKYDSDIREKRSDAQQSLLDATGAVAWRERSEWGGGSYVTDLAFPRDSKLILGGHIKEVTRSYHADLPVVCVRGKLNSKAGIAFNKPINDANKILKELPSFTDWVVSEFNIMRTGLGGNHPSGRGTAMISTYGGRCGDVLVFGIPNNENEKHGEVEIPSCFEKISYGQFYDMTSGDGDD